MFCFCMDFWDEKLVIIYTICKRNIVLVFAVYIRKFRQLHYPHCILVIYKEHQTEAFI